MFQPGRAEQWAPFVRTDHRTTATGGSTAPGFRHQHPPRNEETRRVLTSPKPRSSRSCGQARKAGEICRSPRGKGNPMKALRHTALLLCIAFAAAADDDDTHFRAALVGTQETPAIFAAGSGIFEARVLNNDTRIEFQLTYEHLTAAPLVAHVHFCQRGGAGAVSFFLCGV